MADVVCPECGLVTTLVSVRRASDEFCEHCDYPLFWAPSAVPVAVEGVGSDTTLRRLPGAGGRQLIGTRVCPACGELNTISAVHCSRCAALLDPPPPPEPEPEPEPVVEPPPPPPAPPAFDWTPIAILLIAALVAVGFIVLT